jgi:hypothetical protein
MGHVQLPVFEPSQKRVDSGEVWGHLIHPKTHARNGASLTELQRVPEAFFIEKRHRHKAILYSLAFTHRRPKEFFVIRSTRVDQRIEADIPNR